MLRQFTCIMCPMGCSLEAEVLPEGRVEKVTGNNCKRGKEYAVREVTNPVRNIASSVLVENGELPLASVRLNAPDSQKGYFSCDGGDQKDKSYGTCFHWPDRASGCTGNRL